MTDIAGRSLVLGTAGHIDHGKTALVRALTGIETDRLEQEKARGISIDIGFAHLDLGGRRLGVVDLPGHERFIRNMLAGAAGIDVALLVVAADDSIMPQTREHLAILRLLHVTRGVIALTKVDLVDDEWVDLVEQDVRALVSGSFLEGAAIVRTSVVSGRGLDELRAAIEAEVGRAAAEPERDAPFRLAIDRSFVLQGLGTVVTGTVWSGALDAGAEIEWLPAARRVRVRGLQSHGADVARATRGQRTAINLMGVHHAEVERGHELAAPGWLVPTRRLTVRLELLADAPWPLRHRARVRLHLGTREVIATVALLGANEVPPGGHLLAQLHLAEPVTATARQPLVLRSESPVWTIGGGLVVQPAPRRIARRDAGAIARLDDLLAADDTVRAEAAAYLAATDAWDAMSLARDADVDVARAEAIIESLLERGRAIDLRVGASGRRRLVHRDVFERIAGLVRRALDGLHASAPLVPAVPRSRLASRLAWIDGDVLRGVCDAMTRAGELRAGDDSVALASFEPALTEAQRRLHDRAVAAYREAGASPPDPASLDEGGRLSEDERRAILELCVSEGHLVHLGGAVYLDAGAELELRRRVAERLAGGAATTSELREALGTSRKHAVPFLEHLDRIGVTRRQGDVRVLR